MKLSNVLLGLTGCFFAASLSGCFIVTTDNPPPAPVPGSITVDFSLDGNPTTLEECKYFLVDGLRVEIDQGSSVITTVDTDCYDNGGVTIKDLDPGFYTVRASLLDASNRVVSDILAVDDLDVSSNIDTNVKANFPGNWIHTGM